ncbi:MAG: DUF3098 domain-containing protein [Bacteroidetes bacterium HGW-Bacteroidetes-12]|nr:MAG: DUF3098 domain-containing protein [Bacteroidetes bacterium HGW-Bacteroidetes-12]
MTKTIKDKIKSKDTDKPVFLFSKKNYILLLTGLGLIGLGFILMIGGGSNDPNVFDGDSLFSFRRITLAPILILGGYVVEIFAIMSRPKK